MLRRYILLLSLGPLATPLLCSTYRQPVFESLDLTLVTLNRLRLQPVSERVPGLLPLKSRALPASVRLYLRPTGQIDFYSSVVGRAAARIRRAVAPGSRTKYNLRDSRLVAQAVGLWLDTHIMPDPGPGSDARPCIDQRLAYPKVSVLLKGGHADGDGRALAALALLRALKVPARLATARGALVVQYWVAAKPALSPKARRHRPRSRASRSHGPQAPLGWWECMDAGVNDYEIDAWSLDPSGLARLRWKPKQELVASLVGWERVAFAEGDSVSARAAFSASLEAGALSGTAMACPLTVAADAVLKNLSAGEVSLWVLTAQHWRLKTEGSMLAMRRVLILTPYRPDLSDWGREQKGSVRASDIEVQGVWSDRPERLRLHKDLQDEWSSPPPAFGMLHWYELGVRRQADLLQAALKDGRVQGVALRSDNLAPRQGWSIVVNAEGSTESARTEVDAGGRFSVLMSPDMVKDRCLDVTLSRPGQENTLQKLLTNLP